MEDWMVIVFVAVSIVIGLIVTAIRKAEEERQRKMLPPRADRPRRPTTDLDRFLEEARRRRGEEIVEPPARPAQQPWARPAARPPQSRRRAPPIAQRPAARPPAFPSSVRRPSAPSQELAPLPVPPPPPKQSRAPVILEIVPDDDDESAPAAAPASALLAAMPPPPPPQAVAILGRPTRQVSPVVKQLQGMLGQPQGMATAFVLSEVFGPPRSRRRMG